MGHDFRANYYDAAAHQSLRPRLARARHGLPEILSRLYGAHERLYSEVAEKNHIKKPRRETGLSFNLNELVKNARIAPQWIRAKTIWARCAFCAEPD